MTDHLIRKLAAFVDFQDDEAEAIRRLCSVTRTFRPGDRILGAGEKPGDIHFLIAGWCHRYKVLPSGQKQILALMMPGDTCDIISFILNRSAYSIAALSTATAAVVSPGALMEVSARYPRIQRALWWSSLVEESVLGEWLVSIGRRDAYQRIAHLFCELAVRARVAGIGDDDGFPLPLKQEQIGEVVALTPVHVNRTIQRLRAEGLIRLGSGHLTICDPAGLAAAASFRPDYLHLDGEEAYASRFCQ